MRPSASQLRALLKFSPSRKVAGWAIGLLAALSVSASASASALPVSTNALPLAESNRVFIAEIEHRGLTLTRRGFPAIAASIRTNAADRLMRYFAPEFRGETLSPEQGPGQENEVLKIHRATSAGEPRQKPVPADANAFVQQQNFGLDAS